MSMITRYILKSFLIIFLVSIASLALIQLSVDFLQKITALYKYQPEFQWLLRYFLLRAPRMLFEMLPLAVLLSTLLTFGGLSKSNEITAFKSTGISVFQLSVPILLFGASTSLFSYYLTGGLIPKLTKQSAVVRAVHIEKRKRFGRFVQNKTWLQLDNKRLMYVQTITADRKRMQGVHLYGLGEDFTLATETNASELIYEADAWVLLNGVRRRFLSDGSVQFSTFDREAIEITQKPSDFQQVAIKKKEMTYRDYTAYIQQVASIGLSATRHEVDLRAKQALPFANFLMVLLGVPFALKGSRSAGIARGIAVSLAVALSYWLVFSITLSLGRLEVLSPWLSAWSANILLLFLGSYLFLKIRQ